MDILIIDDHQLFIDGVRHVLEKLDEDAVVTEANRAEQTIEILESGKSFDLILIDLVMPDMSGLSVIQRFHEQGVWLPLVVMSGDDNVRNVKSALEMGALGFIPKTFSSQQMLAALRRIFSGDIFVPQYIAIQLNALKVRRVPKAGNLTNRQRQVLELMSQGYSNRQIATSLFITEHTVKAHVSALFIELNATNRTDCVHIARTQGMIETR